LENQVEDWGELNVGGAMEALKANYQCNLLDLKQWRSTKKSQWIQAFELPFASE
jgi:hypothetical protein